jgi:hypothetical protein
VKIWALFFENVGWEDTLADIKIKINITPAFIHECHRHLTKNRKEIFLHEPFLKELMTDNNINKGENALID